MDTKGSDLFYSFFIKLNLESLIHAGSAPARTRTEARMLLLSAHSRGQRRTDAEVAQALLFELAAHAIALTIEVTPAPLPIVLN